MNDGQLCPGRDRSHSGKKFLDQTHQEHGASKPEGKVKRFPPPQSPQRRVPFVSNAAVPMKKGETDYISLLRPPPRTRPRSLPTHTLHPNNAHNPVKNAKLANCKQIPAKKIF